MQKEPHSFSQLQVYKNIIWSMQQDIKDKYK